MKEIKGYKIGLVIYDEMKEIGIEKITSQVLQNLPVKKDAKK